MKSVNLLPESIKNRMQLNKLFLKYTTLMVVFFLLLILIVLWLDMSKRVVRNEIQAYTDMLGDEKYIESERIAGQMRERLMSQTDLSEFSEAVISENIDMEMLALTVGVMLDTRNDGKIMLIEDILYDNEGMISLSGIASERSLIGLLAAELRDKNVFVDIDVPMVMSEPGGAYRFKLLLMTAVSE